MSFHEIVFPFISSTYSSSPYYDISFSYLFPPVESPPDSLVPFHSPHVSPQSIPMVDPIPVVEHVPQLNLFLSCRHRILYPLRLNPRSLMMLEF